MRVGNASLTGHGERAAGERGLPNPTIGWEVVYGASFSSACQFARTDIAAEQAEPGPMKRAEFGEKRIVR